MVNLEHVWVNLIKRWLSFFQEASVLANELLISRYREHTILLNRKRVNKGMKRTNSLPLSPVVIFYATLQRKPLVTSPA